MAAGKPYVRLARGVYGLKTTLVVPGIVEMEGRTTYATNGREPPDAEARTVAKALGISVHYGVPRAQLLEEWRQEKARLSAMQRMRTDVDDLARRIACNTRVINAIKK